VSSVGTIKADREVSVTLLAFQDKECLRRRRRYASSQNLMMMTDHGPVLANESEDQATISTLTEKAVTGHRGWTDSGRRTKWGVVFS
jgi:hypothetical protein